MLDTPSDCGSLRRYNWNREDRTLREAKLEPPRELLRHLVLNPPRDVAEWKASEATREKRLTLARGNADVVAEALAFLARSTLPERAWYILEGRSQPDVYLETDQCLVVVEGKRTELAPTTHTSGVPGRHQMLRHIDCAWEARGGRSVFGFFAVSGGCTAADIDVPTQWANAAAATVALDTLEVSLPHRTEADRTSIASCFLGATTWQTICAEFGLDWSKLPDTCGGPRADAGSG